MRFRACWVSAVYGSWNLGFWVLRVSRLSVHALRVLGLMLVVFRDMQVVPSASCNPEAGSW